MLSWFPMVVVVDGGSKEAVHHVVWGGTVNECLRSVSKRTKKLEQNPLQLYPDNLTFRKSVRGSSSGDITAFCGDIYTRGGEVKLKNITRQLVAGKRRRRTNSRNCFAPRINFCDNCLNDGKGFKAYTVILLGKEARPPGH